VTQDHRTNQPFVNTAKPKQSVSEAMEKLAAKKHAVPASAVKESFKSGESPKRGILFKKYDYSCQIVVADWMPLSVMLSTFNNYLLDWNISRGNQCGKVYLSITTLPEHFDAVQAMIKRWAENDACTFLKKRGVKLTLTNIKTGDEQSINVTL
jgi:hypothetical protein